MSTRLCGVCNGIFTGLLVVKRDIPHHQSVASLRRSAEEGCYICDSVASLVMAHNDVFHDNHAFWWRLDLLGSEKLIGYFVCHGELIIKFTHYSYIFPLIFTASPKSGYSLVPSHSLDVGASLTDQAVMETARSWLENCRRNHPLCAPVDPAFNPTRLIYINDASSVQLIETEKEAKTHAYVAFSHCWGGTKTLRLLQDDGKEKGNIEELRSLFQVQRLPTSYREAISVSLALGFRHIWIDSLCIIQNSHDDWAKESAMMKDVYSNSSLNLCASAAADSSEASFQHRDRGNCLPMDIEPQWTGIFDGGFRTDKLGPLPSYLHRVKYKLVKKQIYELEINNSPLNRRAWVMQERILSRRHLFMTRHQLWWECRDRFVSEVFPAGVPEYLYDYGETRRVQYYTFSTHGHHSPHHEAIRDVSPVGQTDNARGKSARHSPSEKLSEGAMNELWGDLVKRYSRCNLTYPADKLPALSGLAQIFSVVQGPGFSLDENSYLAGIWRPQLPNALCWKSYSDEGSGQVRSYRPETYCAPSWSWASIQGPVKVWPSKLFEPVCCILDAKVIQKDERYKAGTVKGGILHLRSRLIGPFTYGKSLDPDGAGSHSQRVYGRVRKAFDVKPSIITWDEQDDESGKHLISYLDLLPHTVRQDGIAEGTKAVRKRVWLKDLADEPRIRLFMVPIIKDSSFHHGLILCQVLKNPGLQGLNDSAVFQRVGVVYGPLAKWNVLDSVPETTIAII